MKPKPKRQKVRQSSPVWREFEKLVARIEHSLVPTGATVKSPDRILSNINGRPREVDASIRYRVGSANVLITVECRKRQPKEVVTWIEQLKAKKEAIGAARTIAVSPKGFSRGAVETAEPYGISLRRLAEVSPDDVRGWLLPQSLIHVFKKCGPVSAEYSLFGVSDSLVDFDEQITGDITHAGIFRSLADGSRLSLSDIWLKAQEQQDFWAGMPADGTTLRAKIVLKIPDNTLAVSTTVGVRCVSEFRMEIDLSWGREEIPLSEATVVHYTSEKGLDVRRIEFLTKSATTSNLRFGLQSEGESREAVLSLEILNPGSKNPDAGQSSGAHVKPRRH